jgi:hypothetical protein
MKSMALIEYAINWDPNGGVTVVGTVMRIDPGDQLILTSKDAGAALKWKTVSPFASPAAGQILPLSNGSPVTVQVVTAMDPTKALARCGERDKDGTFKPWTHSKNGFPGGNGGTQGPKNR